MLFFSGLIDAFSTSSCKESRFYKFLLRAHLKHAGHGSNILRTFIGDKIDLDYAKNTDRKPVENQNSKLLKKVQAAKWKVPKKLRAMFDFGC